MYDGSRASPQPFYESTLYVMLPCLPVCTLPGPAVVSYTTSGSKGKHGEEVEEELVFRGAVLEGLNGKSLDKRLEEDPSFCDIDFLLACLQQVSEGVKGWVSERHCSPHSSALARVHSIC